MKHEIEHLKHIRDECEFILTKSEELTQELFFKDETLKRAFVRSIEIIGEATKNISTEFRFKYPDIYKGLGFRPRHCESCVVCI